MAQIICLVCETEIAEDTDLCPECGWEIDRSAGELIIGDPTELQQEAERKHRKLQHYRRLYQQAKRVEGLETRITELEQERQTTQERFEQLLAALEQGQQQNSHIETIQNRLDTLEVWQQRMLKRHRFRSTPLTVSDDDMQRIFHVKDENRRPLHYVVNDFERQGQVVTDHATGLMWQKSCSEKGLTYAETLKYIEQLNRKHFAGYTDWRLPTVNELLSLMTETKENDFDLYISTVFDTRHRGCWTVDKRSYESAWGVNFLFGYVGSYDVDSGFNYVRVVRP